MSRRIARLAQIASTQKRKGMIPVSPATIWRWVKRKKFPQPFKLSNSVTVWDLAQVEAHIAQCAVSPTNVSQKRARRKTHRPQDEGQSINAIVPDEEQIKNSDQRPVQFD